MMGRVLIVDDDSNMCELIETDLKHRGIDSCWFTNAEDAFKSMKNEDFDVVLTDLKMPGISGLELCERIIANRPDIPVVVMTAFGSMETAIAAIRVGAYDFVTKPIEMDMLALSLRRAMRFRELQEKVKILTADSNSRRFDEILGESPRMMSLYDMIDRVADSETSILILGESGTGKELVARALHQKSRRRNEMFVPINCASLPANLLESELFGHSRGAFTDAHIERKGLFVQAHGGTLFLDELCDLPLDLQPKLLRALEQRSVRPVGSNKEIPVDVRIVAATNRDPETAIENGRFREDLYFRINVIQIELPPLRTRGTDVLLLAQHFIKYFAKRSGKPVTGISKPVAEKLLNYSWPGNVRELKNAIEHSVALTRFDKIGVGDLPEKINSYQSSHVVVGSNNPLELVSMEEVERRYIIHVLQSAKGNKSIAARILGFDRKTLHRKLQRYNIHENGTA